MYGLSLFAEGLELVSLDYPLLRQLSPDLLEAMAEDFKRHFGDIAIAQGYATGLCIVASEMREVAS